MIRLRPECENGARSRLRLRAARLDEALQWPLPAETWLVDEELRELACFRSSRRRAEWLGGRWCAKQLLAEMFSTGIDWRQWAILSRRSPTRGCRPAIYRGGEVQSISLSVTHTDKLVAVLAAPTLSVRVGVDAVERHSLSDSFAKLWFSREECRVLDRGGFAVESGWAAKEAVFKAYNERGESFRPRRLRVVDAVGDSCWLELNVRGRQVEVESRIYLIDKAFVAVAVRTESARRQTSSEEMLTRGYASLRRTEEYRP